MKLPRSVIVASLVALSATGARAAQCEPEKAVQKYPAYAGKVVKIAASPSQPPFAFSDPKAPDRMTGLEAEMVEAAMTCAGLKFEYLKGAWSALLPAMYSGSADIMIGAVNLRPERAERVDFILYMRGGQSVIVAKGNPKRIGDLDSLCGHVGSTNANGSPAQVIARQSQACVEHGKPPIDFQPSVDTDSSYRQIETGRVDFVMDDAASAATRVERQPELEVAHTITTDILSGVIVGKGNKDMLRAVADGFRAQAQDGTLAKLASKYGLPADTIIPIETRD